MFTQLIQPGVSKHLRKLRDVGLVIINKGSRKHIYRLNAEPLAEIDNWLASYRKYSLDKLDTLEQLLAEEE